MRLRPARAGDAVAMAAVHAEAFDAPWSAREIAALVAGPGGLAFVAAEEGGRLAGFILCRAIAGESEVLTIAVAPPRRRQGVARALLQAASLAADAAGCGAVFLEVAEDNAPALALYTAAGFAQIGRRGAYYGRRGGPAVAALVLRRDLNT